MSGPEHYKRAEQLEQLAVRQFESSSVDEERGYDPSPLWQLTIAQAQVHATLALAAATAEAAFDPEGRCMVSEGHAWAVVAS